MIELRLRNCNLNVLIDNEDYDRVMLLKWRINDKGYPTSSLRIDGKNKTIYMHRYIMCAQKTDRFDHIDRNPLNNQKLNLRPATHAQNCRNRIHPRRVAPYKGLSFKSEKKWWKVRIMVDRKSIYVGGSVDPKIAARMYNEAALKYHGQFASLNVI